MKIFEFFGESGAGKSFLFKKINIKYKKKNIFTFKTIFYFYLLKKNKISYLKYKVIKFLIINEIGKSKNLFIKIFSNFYFNVEQDTKKERKLFFKEIKVKYNNFFEFYVNQLKKIKDKKEQKLLKKWIIEVLIGHYLAKENYKDTILLAPEGFYQRIYSLYKRTLISRKILQKIILLTPKVDKVFLIKSIKTPNHKIQKIFEVIKKKKIKNLTIYNNKKDLKNNLKIIVKNLK
tara:strand:+ start:246 stop:944 length:699 start_codon:yes stop_codon:yes gene_type:complete